ncbi:MAG: hypothetical protein ACRC17_12080 [Culicoidibacterales bacterium]
MKIVVTFSDGFRNNDYQIGDDLKIEVVLDLLRINDGWQIPDDLQYVFSRRNKENISVHRTFKSAKILNGDIVELKRGI